MNENNLPLRYKAVDAFHNSDVGELVEDNDFPYKVVGHTNNGIRRTRLELYDPEGNIKARFD